MKSRTICLASPPTGKLNLSHFDVCDTELDAPRDGEVLVRNIWLSIDPSIRLRLGPDRPAGYLPPIQPGDALSGLALGEVLDSRSDGFSPGDVVSHMMGYRDYAVIDSVAGGLGGAGTSTKIDSKSFPIQWFLGPLGSSGLTAYVGLFDVLGIESTDTLWVSAAAGAVGSIAAQLAKLHGCTVVASAGSADKVAFLRESLGVTRAFDYHDGDVGALLAHAAPDGIDAYFDNVGGGHFAAALDHLNTGGRVAMCGAVSTYGASGSMPSNLFQITAKSLRLQGFRAGAYNHLYDDMRALVGGYLQNGTLIYQESVYDGLEQAPAALVGMLNGDTTGKTLVRVGQ
ncbi:NADP-dependent oxidoreductase [Rhodococcus sp. BP-252]|uniref:NADP-dependent oxidoreductase n=1 Tax=Rhodococcoides kyotonense TaxID=398843 RepID=A0A177YMX9_9NOCA|nr:MULTISPECIES: NADP-dependent oxidoreductase [Rhodococcus]MBY6412195.1 NADP-dependent oxidoreductase [Rhodococcus sp. BP-320]MBY6416775.1 NADP-dependent oxidoreductase [Rhodococcus sp. BP-321]MBY6421036.1 NADP-dependent oxidoreductase [Rhodococcus sp. BP-324]MBY6426799.1 NADP-dependent oxidoreductase [Rhodococcus sp. BP-323]MBY6431798.1 NADP-dependent oxidoreductase [Rhodococcus sp. BP-322]